MSQSSLHQAAVILKSLPKLQAAKILSRLEAADIKTVFQAIAKIDHVSATEISLALRKLDEESSPSPDTQPGTQLEQFLSRHQAATQRRTTRVDPSYRPFAFIVDLAPQVRHKLLCDEHPKIIAMVLAELPPEISSEVIGKLDPAMRISVLRRLCDADLATGEEIAEISYALKLRVKKLLNKNAYRSSGVETVAAVLSCSDPDTQNEVLAHMVQTDPDLAERIENSVFVFADIVSLSDEEVKTILQKADTSLWAPALKRASLAMRQKILSNMADRAAKLLTAEISTIGDVDEHVALRAQQQVVNLILRLRRLENSQQRSKTSPVNPSTDSPIYIRT